MIKSVADNYLPVKEYVQQLQIEYLQCRIREIFYPKERDKAYWIKTANLKEDKVASVIANQRQKYEHVTIFDESEKGKEYLNQLLELIGSRKGFPKMKYAQNQSDVVVKDRFYYYNIGSEFKLKSDDSKIYELVDYENSRDLAKLVKDVSFNNFPIPKEVSDISIFTMRSCKLINISTKEKASCKLFDLVRHDLI